MSGGTDVCSAFVGGNPMWPVYAGEIQCRALACSLEAFNETGQAMQDEMGEMVISCFWKPMALNRRIIQPSKKFDLWYWTDALRKEPTVMPVCAFMSVYGRSSPVAYPKEKTSSISSHNHLKHTTKTHNHHQYYLHNREGLQR